ncbi:DUF6056 family protein [Helicobacter muridarum]|uniref:DUF6056 family protein n=1 Tax=Helicobacter muridarum TaxID=216 RepID=UPI000CF12708|nr:DUF6056 family protein [Helicobacter muridarum]
MTKRVVSPPPPISISSHSVNIFLLIYCPLLLLNFMFPTQSDDLGAKIGGISAAISSYFNWNGRLGELIKVSFGSYFSTTIYYNFINAFVGVCVIFQIFFLIFVRFPRGTFFDYSVCSIIIVVLLYDSAFGSIFLWAAGSYNYLWGWCLILFWLIPYRLFWHNIINNNLSTQDSKSKFKIISMLLLGILAGWCSEFGIAIILLQVFILVYASIRYKVKVPLWCWWGLAGFCIGWVILYISPGHAKRSMLFSYYFSLRDLWNLSFKDKIYLFFTFSGKLSVNKVWFFIIVWATYMMCLLKHKHITYKILAIILVIAFFYIFRSLVSLFVFLLINFICIMYFAFDSKRRGMLAEQKLFFGVAMLLFVYALFTACTIQISVPHRALFQSTILMSILCVIVFNYIWNLYKFVGMLLGVCSNVVCIIYVIFVFSACLDMYAKWNNMLGFIDGQKELGHKDVRVDKKTFQSYYRNYGNWANPVSDVHVWPNTDYAKYFGLNSFGTRIDNLESNDEKSTQK